MLKSLTIRNYALIESLDMNFHSGFSVITGETGAGKSILLGAIGLLLGQRADVKVLRTGTDKCIIEGCFDIAPYHMEPLFEENDWEYSPECILRRELTSSGKSRAFVNDTPVALTQVKALGDRLIDIHSQHQNLLLNTQHFQLDVLDILAADQAEKELYTKSFTTYRTLREQLRQEKERVEKSKADEEFIRFQLQQLEEAHLTEGEQESLEEEQALLAHAEEIKTALFKTGESIQGDEEGYLRTLKSNHTQLSALVRFFPKAEAWAARLESCYLELKDLADELTTEEERIEFSPSRMEEVKNRLDLIYGLQQKHHVQTVNELLVLEAGYREKRTFMDHADEHLAQLEQQEHAAYAAVLKQAARLTEARAKAARLMEREMKQRLVPLGMPNAQFAVAIQSAKEPDATGMDSVCFLFSANKSSHLQDIAEVASGGEISRIMLSLKSLIAGATELPTVIFDEIDTGVSGAIADRMGLLMQQMGQAERQVISITHLPQIAAKGSTHYKVYKQDNATSTATHIKELAPEERVQEIAQMMSGAVLTEAALNNAKELLKENEALSPKAAKEQTL